MLFHDARLSHDGWFSCHSCHTDGHTNGLLADTLGDGSYGTPKRVPSLRGVKDTGPFGWTGGAKDLEAQLRSSVETTMRGPSSPPPRRPTCWPTCGRSAAAAAQPVRGEAAGGGRAPRRGGVPRQGCAACHEPPAYTSAKTYDVGLADEAGTGRSTRPRSAA